MKREEIEAKLGVQNALAWITRRNLLTFLLVVGNLADCALTLYCLRHGGYEANPLMAKLLASQLGVWKFVLVKGLLGSVLFVYVMGKIQAFRRGGAPPDLLGPIGVHTLVLLQWIVVVNNVVSAFVLTFLIS